MESVEYHEALAALTWQIELGATEAIADQPVDRYARATAETAQGAKVPAQPAPAVSATADPVEEARRAAASARDLDALRAALDA